MRFRLSLASVGTGRILFTLVAMLGAVATGLTQSSRPSFRPLEMHPPAGVESSTQLGRVAADVHLSISVSLGYRDPSGMQKFVDSLSDPHSANYRHFVKPAEVGRRFGPLPATVQSVRSYLERNGFAIRLVGENGLSILADGTAGQAETAFHTQIFEFSSPDGYTPSGGRLFSFVTTPSLPADLLPFVIDISGLETFTHPKPLNSWVTPNQIQTLYDLTPMYSQGTQGQGRTIAISSWDGYRLSNVPFEYSMFNLPAPAGGVGSNITVKAIDGGCGSGSEQGEADLDIQSILGVAPLCNLVIYDGNGGDLINVLTQEANDDQADVISESYGWMLSASSMLAAHNLHLSMSAEGITYMAASGDSGTSLSYYYPNIEPEVLSVGGTTCSTDSAGHRISETGWGGSGGGWKPTSDPFNLLPGYQAGTGVPTNIPYRLIPDVALNADPNSGYVVYLDGNYYVIGGTSGASPTFAGSLGDSEQQLIANGGLSADGNGHYRFGRIQDLIYSFNGDPSVFYDVTVGSNGSLPNGSTSSAGTGWDFVTGWGAMDFNGFVTRLSVSGLVQFSLSPAALEGGTGSVTATVALSSAAPSGGQPVVISGGDSSISCPASVTIPAGSKSTTFTITTTAVAAQDSEALTASAQSTSKNATLVLNPTSLAGLSFSPTSGVGGSTFTGTVTLVHAATTSGDVVHLSGGDSSISYPSTVTVAAGAKTATFTVTSKVVSSSDPESLTASLGGSSKTASITLTALTVSSIAFSPSSVVGGASSTGTVTLSAAAPSTGATVALSGGDSYVGYPATVTVAAGAKSAKFTTTTQANYMQPDLEYIQASLGSSFSNGLLTVNRATIASFAFSPSTIYGGASSSGTITLTGPAGSSGLNIALSGGDPSVQYPGMVTVAAGAKSVTFSVTSSVVSTVDAETIGANLYNSTTNALLTVRPAGILASLSFSPSSFVGGKTTTGTVKLTYAAAPGGVTVALSGGDSSISYPASVAIAAGATSATFTVSSSTVSANDTENLTAKLGPSSANGSCTVMAPTVAGLAFSPNSVTGGTSSTGTITLTSAAGPAGEVVSLSGGDSTVSYPATVTIPAGATSATFTINTVKVTKSITERITATLGTSKVGALTVHT